MGQETSWYIAGRVASEITNSKQTQENIIMQML